VPGDYDGDGIHDPAVWRPANGVWYVLTSGSGFVSSMRVPWGSGAVGDVPVPADYDGDGRTDIAVWRPSTGTWYVKTSSSGFASSFTVAWGSGAVGDRPVPGDYDGDGRADIAVWRAPLGTWFILRSHVDYSTAYPYIVSWGSSLVGDQPVLGDYDGDGATDITVWRGPTGRWFLLPSGGGFRSAFASYVDWGGRSSGDQPVAGDFDGDGRSDVAVWRGPAGTWFVKTSSSGFVESSAVQWGTSLLADVPVTR
jgi:hypothetical protein